MERREEFLGMRKTGLTLQAIAHRVGLSKERVRQILKGHQPPVKPPMELKAMLNVREAAQLLGIHVNTVRRWTQKGLLPVYRLGARGDRRFRREDIDAFLSGARTTRGGGKGETNGSDQRNIPIFSSIHIGQDKEAH